MRKSILALAAGSLACFAVPAAAAPYDFSYGFGSTVYASGRINTDETQPCGPGCFLVGSVTGFNRGAAISGFDPFDLQSDQHLYPTQIGAFVDGSGLTYSVGGSSYNIYSVGSGNYNEYQFDPQTGAQIGQSAFVTFFTLSPASVPEPSSWALLIAGIGLAGTALRRRPGKVIYNRVRRAA